MKSRRHSQTQYLHKKSKIFKHFCIFLSILLFVILLTQKHEIIHFNKELAGILVKKIYTEKIQWKVMREYIAILKKYSFLLNNTSVIFANEKKLAHLTLQNLLLQHENAKLKIIMNYQDNKYYKSIISRIIIKNGNSFYNRHVLNIGFINEVKNGNAVIVNNKLIGRIINVTSHTSVMQNINDMGFQVPIIILDTNIKALGVYKYPHNCLQLNYLSQEIEIPINLTAVTSGEGGMIPYGLFIGKTIKKNGKICISLHIDNNHDIVSVLAEKNLR